jgi:hypothetical protein
MQAFASKTMQILRNHMDIMIDPAPQTDRAYIAQRRIADKPAVWTGCIPIDFKRNLMPAVRQPGICSYGFALYGVLAFGCGNIPSLRMTRNRLSGQRV